MTLRSSVRTSLAGFPLLDAMFRRFIWSRVHFPEIEMRFIDSLRAGQIDIAVDVGAATGSYAWILNRKSREVYSFEPGVDHGAYLQRAAFASHIKVVRAAVGDVCGAVQMFTPGTDTEALHSATLSSGNPVIQDARTQVREVEQVTLDSFFASRLPSDRRVDLVKIDVEGYEHQVLKGAQSLISRYHPLIFCEIEKRHNAGYGEIFSFLRSLGYSSFIYRDGRFERFDGDALDELQRPEALKVRLGGNYDPRKNMYVNNFVFQHQSSRLKVAS